jgi:hypothetical protein
MYDNDIPYKTTWRVFNTDIYEELSEADLLKEILL